MTEDFSPNDVRTYADGEYIAQIADNYVVAIKGRKSIQFHAEGKCDYCPDIHAADPHYDDVSRFFGDVMLGTSLGLWVEFCFYANDCDELCVPISYAGFMRYMRGRIAIQN